MTAPSTTWAIIGLDREVSTGKVSIAHYAVSLVQGEHVAGTYGSVALVGELSVPFDDLTEPVVLGWVQDSLGADELQHIHTQLEAQLEEQRAPKMASGLPW